MSLNGDPDWKARTANAENKIEGLVDGMVLAVDNTQEEEKNNIKQYTIAKVSNFILLKIL